MISTNQSSVNRHYDASDLIFNDRIFYTSNKKKSQIVSTNSSNRINRITSDSSSNGTVSTTGSKQKRIHKKTMNNSTDEISPADQELKNNCDIVMAGLPGNQLDSVKNRRSSQADGLRYQERELLVISKAFVIDVFQMQFNTIDYLSYMAYVKINVANENKTSDQIEIFTTDEFNAITTQPAFMCKMNRFITDERHKWLNYWNSVLMDRKSIVLQASMDNIKFEVASALPMFGMIGDTGMGKRIFSIEQGYVFFFYY